AAGGVHDLAHQTVGHGVLATRPRVVHQPPQGQRGPRCGRTSTGTWYVAPPTRLERTSSSGRAFSTAFFSVITGSLAVRSLMTSRALYTVRSARLFLPCNRTLLMSCVTSGFW